jgi:DNA invertase Pin-like site-specific DNA recombinase
LALRVRPLTGGSDIGRRDGLQDLIRFVEARAAANPIRVIICWAIDRLSRSDTLETFEVLSRLRRAGVRRILTNSRTFNLHDKIDRTLLAVEQDFTGSGYVRKLSENTTRALYDQAKEGRWVNRVPYAYVISVIGHDSKGLPIKGPLTLGDPFKVEAIRWMFETYATTSVSLRQLARKLELRGAPPPKGGWTRDIVGWLLHNEAHIGTFRWNDEHTGRHCRVKGGQVTEFRSEDVTRPGGKNRGKSNPEDIVVIHDAHPAIVDRATFDAVARKLERNRGRRTTSMRKGKGRIWPRSGLAICGNCRGRMVGRIERRQSRGKTYTYEILFCPQAERGCVKCGTNRVSHERVLVETASLIRERLTDPAHLAALKADVAQFVESVEGDTTAERDRLRVALSDLDRKLDQGAERMLTCPVEVQARAAAKLREWATEREALARDLLKLEAVADHREGTAERFEDALGALSQLEQIVTSGDPETVRDAFSNVLDSVRLKFNHDRQLKNGYRRTYLKKIEVDLLPEISCLLTMTSHPQQVCVTLSREFEPDGTRRPGTAMARRAG